MQSNGVEGQWKPFRQIIAGASDSWKVGTTFSKTKTDTVEWSNSVTQKAEVAMKFSSFSESFRVSTTVSKTVTQQYQHSWSETKEYTHTQQWSEKYDQKFSWRFFVVSSGDCNTGSTSSTLTFAVTPSAAWKPCCVPGYNADDFYTSCKKGGMINDPKLIEQGCKVADNQEL